MAKKEQKFYTGGIASMMAAVCTHPLDLIKVRMQTIHTPRGEKPANFVRTGVQIVRSEGILALYKGLSASLFRQGTYSTIRFGVYARLKEGTDPANRDHLLTKIWQASLAGVMGGMAGTPGDVANIRMQADGKKEPHLRRNYRHVGDAFSRIVREEGALALWSGVAPNLVRAALMTTGQAASYDQFKQMALNFGLSDNVSTHFLCSFMAGFVATGLTQPVDVIKTRVMNAAVGDEYASVPRAVALTWTKEGLPAFFKGYISLYPTTSSSF